MIELSEEFCQILFEAGYRETINTIVRRTQELFIAEASELFLSNPHWSEDLRLEARYSDKLQYAFEGLSIIPRRGADVSLEHFPEALVSRHDTVDVAGGFCNKTLSWEHLETGLRSRLSITVKDHHSRVLARLEIHNNKMAREFDEADKQLGITLSKILSYLLWDLRVLQHIKSLLLAIGGNKSAENVLDEVLWVSLSLAGADRGDIALFNVPRNQLIIVAQRGDSALAMRKGLPVNSVLVNLWASRSNSAEGFDLISDVRERNYYYPANGFTRSELAVLFNEGVLNVESFRFHTFGEKDRILLQDLAQCASIAMSMLGRMPPAPELVLTKSFGEDSANTNEWLRLLAMPSWENVLEEPQESGNIFICDDSRRLLHIAASVGCQGLEIDPRDFAFQYEETALATKVRRERAPYITGMPLDDRNVHREIARKFHIEGPILGVPLLFGKHVVGVLVMWKRGEPPIDDHEARARLAPRLIKLQNVAPSLAAVIRGWDSTHKLSLMLAGLQNILLTGQVEKAVERKLLLALEALRLNGFDRVRLFRWDTTRRRFIGWLSTGMDIPELFVGIEIDPAQNPYAQDAVATAFRQPAARKYEPMIQPDPITQRFENDPTLPWATVPLSFMGRLYGLIIVDSGRTGRDITRDGIDYLTVIGAVASQIIASDASAAIAVGSDYQLTIQT